MFLKILKIYQLKNWDGVVPPPPPPPPPVPTGPKKEIEEKLFNE
jgi:hypothetical protein